MPFSVRKTHSIEQLAEKAEEYATVIVPDSSLVEPLNERIEGKVSTPMKLGFDGEYRQKLFLKFAEEMSWKQASYFLKNAESCLQSTGKLEGLKEKGLDNSEIENIRELMEKVENPYNSESVDIERPVLVLDEDRFNEIEKRILPEEYDSISSFKDESRELGKFYSFRSAGELAQAVVESAEKIGADDIAVVSPSNSRHRSLIESRLESEGIEFTRSLALSESENLRTYIGLMRAAVSNNPLRVEDIRPVISQLKISVSRRHDPKLLSRLEHADARDLKELLNVLQHMNFGEALEKLDELGAETHKIKAVLDRLGLENREVNRANLSKLEYYIQRFDPSENEENGVLLVTPENGTFIDRDYVVFAGFTTEWNREPDEKPWTDERKQRDVIRDEFELMLQSGTNQRYLVDESEQRLCFNLTQILGVSPTDFEELEAVRTAPSQREGQGGFAKKQTNIETERVEMLSQSRLNSFALSPRVYYFDRLIPSADKKVMKKGRLFHDFAEFYVNYPDFTEEQDYIEFMVEEIKPYLDEIELDEIRTEFEIGTRNIKKYVRREEISSKEIEEYEAESGNKFAKKYGKELRFEVTELEFTDEEMGATGKIDFVKNRAHLIDYKSGRKKTENKIIEASKVDMYEDARFPNFQPIMYLAEHRKINPDERLKFTFFHFLHEIGDHIKGDGDLDETLVTVEYIPKSFQEHIGTDEVFEYLTDGVAKSNDRRKTLEKIGKERYKDFIENTEVPDTHETSEFLESRFFEDFIKLGKERVGDYKYVEKGVKSAVKKLVKIRNANYFKKDLDRFEEFLGEQIEELNRCKENGFPIDGNPDDLPERDLLIEARK
ncbi:PD-(D/E)XK nuclease family protein [Candidatus Nanohalococcus occultus]|uniref:PD-(D/E)XK endonuclease-like domain-containing protein n=1 Tax=Candidatus Nanohalococcus occultus TaxID=2978047 RepID=A0ABY8CI96_9ARCH|nr:Uncharacterized protein SVXNc_0597 [Candidatus Nanohaloarchaeota archaeon SVXNc]